MSSSSPPFIALAAEGRISPAAIDDFVDRWHEDHGDRHLHDYLGMTQPEYALWLVEPDLLDLIVKARAERVSLPKLVSDILEDRRGGGETHRTLPIERWLVEQNAPTDPSSA